MQEVVRMADRNFKRNNDLTKRHRLGRIFQSGMIRKGLTQEELAEKVGLTKKSISFIENGKTYPSPENIFRITKTPDLSLDEFVFCSIKASLKTRLDASKTLVLIVGENTKNLKSGSCAYCGSYNSYQG